MRELILTILVLNFCLVWTFTDWSNDQNPTKWNNLAFEKINSILNRKINNKIAKNIILFIGDGMGVNTVNGGRIRKGQKLGVTYIDNQIITLR
jgi:alkaline phosphatase